MSRARYDVGGFGNRRTFCMFLERIDRELEAMYTKAQEHIKPGRERNNADLCRALHDLDRARCALADAIQRVTV